MSGIRDQLVRMETKVDRMGEDIASVKAEVDILRRKASFWGAVGGVAMALMTHLAGCLH